MLKKRIIPTLLWKDYGLVKGIGFNSWRRIGTVLPAIKVYNTRNVDELILLDITATKNHRDPDYDSISDFAEDCFVPFTVGGGINCIEHIRNLLRSGVDKVSINTAAYENIEIVRQASDYFGSQCIVASIDAQRKDKNAYECYSHCGTKPTGKTPGEWAQELEKKGVGEILITSIDRDGSMDGYDFELIQRVSGAVKIPVIVSGGAGSYEDLYQAFKMSNVSAVAAASMYHFSEKTPNEAKQFLCDRDIPVRIV